MSATVLNDCDVSRSLMRDLSKPQGVCPLGPDRAWLRHCRTNGAEINRDGLLKRQADRYQPPYFPVETAAVLARKVERPDNPHRGMALAYLSWDSTMKAISDEFGLHCTIVRPAVKTYEKERYKDRHTPTASPL